jgi:cytosine/adenosine deaminase-related metal-dependent hydrolase
MFSVMRSAYLFERARDGLDFTARDDLRLATIDGARVRVAA